MSFSLFTVIALALPGGLAFDEAAVSCFVNRDHRTGAPEYYSVQSCVDRLGQGIRQLDSAALSQDRQIQQLMRNLQLAERRMNDLERRIRELESR